MVLQRDMIAAMASVKRYVTIDEGLAREVRALVGEDFNAFVSEALSRHVRGLKLERLVQADETERGSVDPNAVAAELAALDHSGEATRSRPG